ncbi:aldo/keto reductase [Candidatus Halocynthiibacter alkanivorans]|uniref:aldo/keto reductase n=1 Tax=Candidatus Halocynthiibacter alkanivorans TaxID=2267619 RepID=UPI000DF21B24|nr:aldo/keto reductase [Candidatus Halocynthiibacter alkanivorans]
MEKTGLGRTGLSVSVAGLGCGGHSRLGLGTGGSPRHAVSVVSAALDAGINFIDTARVYGTEDIVGQAIAGRRDQVVISTKLPVVQPGTSALGAQHVPAADSIASVEDSLQRLGTDHIDILHLHGVVASQYEYCLNELVPAMQQLQQQGKIRFLGLTERFIFDPQHSMLTRALQDDCWDVFMVGFNLINQSARQRILQKTADKNIGVLNMFAVRRALSRPEALLQLIAEMADNELIDATRFDLRDPLGFLLDDSDADTIVEAAYRFCRHQRGVDVVLTGTGNTGHLNENAAAIQKGPLPGPCVARLQELFGGIDSVSGN